MGDKRDDEALRLLVGHVRQDGGCVLLVPARIRPVIEELAAEMYCDEPMGETQAFIQVAGVAMERGLCWLATQYQRPRDMPEWLQEAVSDVDVEALLPWVMGLGLPEGEAVFNKLRAIVGLSQQALAQRILNAGLREVATECGVDVDAKEDEGD